MTPSPTGPGPRPQFSPRPDVKVTPTREGGIPEDATTMDVGGRLGADVENLDLGLDIGITSGLPGHTMDGPRVFIDPERRSLEVEAGLVEPTAKELLDLRRIDPALINLSDGEVYDEFRAQFEAAPWSAKMNPYFEAMALCVGDPASDLVFSDFETEIVTAIQRGNEFPLTMAAQVLANGGVVAEGTIGWKASDALALFRVVAMEGTRGQEKVHRHLSPIAEEVFDVARREFDRRDLWEFYGAVGHSGFCPKMVDALKEPPMGAWRMDRDELRASIASRVDAMAALAACGWSAAHGFGTASNETEQVARMRTWVEANSALICCVSSQAFEVQKAALKELDTMASGVSVPVEFYEAMAARMASK